MSVIKLPESNKKAIERFALGLTRDAVPCECQTCGHRTASQVNRYGWGDACRACGEDDLRAIARGEG